jgi:hypothetical protein
LVRGLISQESLFVADAVSPTNAFGYGQFTGIGARQVKNIAQMTGKAADLIDFTKADASDPDRGIKAICATLWWLFYKKYHRVQDKKIQLEAVLTFYNSGGRPAALVIKYGGHKEAIPYIEALPRNLQSQAAHYAPQVSAWFVRWYQHMQTEVIAPIVDRPDPFNDTDTAFTAHYNALISSLLLMSSFDDDVDAIVNVQDGLTELTLIFPGEFSE